MKVSNRAAFTLTELLVVIAVIGIIVSLSAAAVLTVRGDSNTTICQAQLGNIGKAVAMALDNKVRITSTTTSSGDPMTWAHHLIPYVDEEVTVFVCPGDAERVGLPDEEIVLSPSYGINHRTHRMGTGDNHRIVMIDYTKPVVEVVGTNPQDFTIGAEPDSEESWNQYLPLDRHAEETNVLFLGGHVNTMFYRDIDPLDCETHYRYWQPMADEAAGRECDENGQDITTN